MYEQTQVEKQRVKRTWSQLRSYIDYGRKQILALSTDIPSNITFKQVKNEHDQVEHRVYYLADDITYKSRTIKYIKLNTNQHETYDLTSYLLLPQQSISSTSTNNNDKLTKEEQLLRERQRMSSGTSGIISYQLDDKMSRFMYRDKTNLYYYDDIDESRVPIKIETRLKGPLDIKTCPYDSNLIAYVLNGDLYCQNLLDKKETRLTNSSNDENTTRGVPSYIIQEEFDRYTGYWWSPCRSAEGKYVIIYEVVDDSCVDKTLIAPACDDPFGCDTYRYTKPGTSNSNVSLELVEFSLNDTVNDDDNHIKVYKMRQPFNALFNWYEYLVRCNWTPNGKYFWCQLLNREQMYSAWYLISIDYFLNSQETAHSIIELFNQTSSVWINCHNIMRFIDLSRSHTESQLSFIHANDSTGYLHLYKYQVSLDSLEQVTNTISKVTCFTCVQLTSGQWTIEYKENINYDHLNQLVYLIGYKNPLESHLYVISLNDDDTNGGMKQLTENGYSHQVTMNHDCSLFIDISSSVQTPFRTFAFKIMNQSMRNIDKLYALSIGQLSLNASDISIAAHNDLQLLKAPKLFSFKTNDGLTLYGMIYYPSDYIQGKLYPTLLYVYAGPHVQLVSNAYKQMKFMRLNILALLGYCVLVIDSRGSDYRGLEFESHIKYKMGQVEIDDQVSGLLYASQEFKCIDQSRVAIFGWSYGGYMSLMGLAQRPDVFKVAIAGAPVTDWTLYDSGYTERYMGLPDRQQDAYSRGSVIQLARSFPNDENRLLILHGLMDENVHFVHTRTLIDALVKHGKPYSLQIYPNERHGMRSSDASFHCDLNLFSFLENNL